MRYSRYVALCIAVLTVAAPCFAITVQGHVFVDQNRNGLMDAGEPGLSGVLVSDGVSVTVSDATGAYRIVSPEASIILRMSRPRNYRPVDSFWRVTDGKAPVDFAVTRSAQGNEFIFIQLTDLHIGDINAWIQAARRINSMRPRPAFTVCTGDLVAATDGIPLDKAQVQYDNFKLGNNVLRMPSFLLPGNHEHAGINFANADKQDPRYGKGIFQLNFGPTYYSWDWGPAHFVALDGTRIPYQEALGETQLAWLAADLKQQPVDKPLLLFCHQPLQSLKDTSKLLALLKGRNATCFGGHWHATGESMLDGHKFYVTGGLCGAWWSGPNPDGSPQGFRVVSVNGKTIKSVYTDRHGELSAALTIDRMKAQSGSMLVKAAVLDMGKTPSAEAVYGGKSWPMHMTGREKLWSSWEGKVDSAAEMDGFRILTLNVKAGEASGATQASFVAVNGRPEPFTAKEDATLTLRAWDVKAAHRVSVNGTEIGTLPAKMKSGDTVSFTVPARLVARLNKVTISAVVDNTKYFSVGNVTLKYGGKDLTDPRFMSWDRCYISSSGFSQLPKNADIYIQIR